ncbi:MAG: hypothetical protein WCS65_17655 [Verrucomicrobiae bacterium]
MIPPAVIEIRQELCHECASIAHDPCAACQHGKWGAYRRCAPEAAPSPIRGLGDVVETAARPIAKLLGIPCHDKDGRLKEGTPCAKRRDALNKAFPF